MTILTADATLQAVLEPFLDEVEIRDAQGQVLGYFTPRAKAEAKRQQRADTVFTQAELEEAERILATQRDKGSPLAEVWKRILAGEHQK
jgi:hypothetical protein